MNASNCFHQIFVHLAWACQDQAPLILPRFQLELDAYIRNYTRQYQGVFLKAITSTPNHVHLAVQIVPSAAISHFVAAIKGNSAQHINRKYCAEGLVWQQGFSAASFAIENLDAVSRYVTEQSIRHEKQTTRPVLEPPDEGAIRNEVYLHATWHCHLDQGMITPETEEIVGKYLPNYCAENECELIGWGGTETHMHVAFKPSPRIKISEAIGRIKGGTTHHVNEAMGRKALQWQHGYGVVSFAGKEIDRVMDYIANQKEHHRKLTIDEVLERCGFPIKGAR